MKEMTLREVQLFELGIRKDVHEFCMANHINYSLAYGTLIGAIRHKGFIPWDDDIDIVMPRPDYDRFCRTYKSQAGYEIFSPIQGNSYLGYTRVCDFKKNLGALHTVVHKKPHRDMDRHLPDGRHHRTRRLKEGIQDFASSRNRECAPDCR